ncbi:MAG: 3-hydroxyacyl-CoA dehydrogenase [Burkholderiales bacterium]|nr:3-hydroxyacyl-CoA dehydrogenase [Burkholderiales bacterium]
MTVDASSKPPAQRVAIVGAGLIGRAWAIVFARAGCAVAITDTAPGATRAALDWIARTLDEMHGFGLIDEPPAGVLARVRTADTLSEALQGAQYVQENVRETLEAKTAIFADMDRIAAPDCVLASSTSFSPASAFSAALAGRARCLVAHPVNPPHVVPVVELCPAPWTDAAAIERARALHAQAGQVPVVVRREVPGFILNRLQAALVCEAVRLYEDGVASAEDIDRTVKDGLGLRWSFMGPMETIDLNAPAGVADYAARYAATMVEMDRAQAPRDWDPAAVARLEAERRARLPAERLGERAAWRDRRLMALAAHKRKMAGDEPAS